MRISEDVFGKNKKDPGENIRGSDGMQKDVFFHYSPDSFEMCALWRKNSFD